MIHHDTVKPNFNKSGFTIVELLVVIVVIGILAAITIVSYSGITQRAAISSLQSDLTNASQELKLYQQLYGSYPTTLDTNNCPITPTVDNTYCLKPSSGTTFSAYQSNNTTNPQTFRLTAVNNNVSYHITNNSQPIATGSHSGAPTNGLIAYYPFDGNANDYSGNGNDATVYGATLANGVIGQAYSFDGVSNYITTPIGSQGTYSLTGWFYRTDTSGSYGTIFGCITSGFELESLPQLWMYNSSILKAPYSLNYWHFFTVESDGIIRSLYLDGIKVGDDSPASLPNLQIGRWVTSQYYKGLIDEVYIYNRALSQDEINTIYNL